MELSELIKRFEENFGRLLSPIEIQQITDWVTVDKFEPEAVYEILKMCVLNNGRTMQYFNATARSFANKGLTTLEAIQLHEVNRNRKKQDQNGNIPEWSNEHSEHEQKEKIPVAENMELYDCFKKWFAEGFNMQLTLGQYQKFAAICEKDPERQFNPFQMCAWILNKPLETIVNRFFTK